MNRIVVCDRLVLWSLRRKRDSGAADVRKEKKRKEKEKEKEKKKKKKKKRKEKETEGK